jgi:hypothetical protein
VVIGLKGARGLGFLVVRHVSIGRSLSRMITGRIRRMRGETYEEGGGFYTWGPSAHRPARAFLVRVGGDRWF